MAKRSEKPMAPPVPRHTCPTHHFDFLLPPPPTSNTSTKKKNKAIIYIFFFLVLLFPNNTRNEARSGGNEPRDTLSIGLEKGNIYLFLVFFFSLSLLSPRVETEEEVKKKAWRGPRVRAPLSRRRCSFFSKVRNKKEMEGKIEHALQVAFSSSSSSSPTSPSLSSSTSFSSCRVDPPFLDLRSIRFWNQNGHFSLADWWRERTMDLFGRLLACFLFIGRLFG